MCGIVGYVGGKDVESNLLSALKLLEYRGYDSAGIAVLDSCGNVETTKEVGRLSNLEDVVTQKNDSWLGIGHTRWATHGKATKENAHPHSGEKSIWNIVHNGIIENYASLKAELVANGVNFKSETDSEVVAQLLEKESEGGVMALVNVTKRLSGSWALGWISP